MSAAREAVSNAMLRKLRAALPVAALALVAVFVAAAWLWLPHWPVFTADEAEEAEATVWPPRSTVEASDSSLPDAGDAHPLLVLAERSPDSAWKRALALGESPERTRLLEAVATLWLARNPRSAMVAFEAAKDGFVSTRWVADQLGVWMAKDERAAADWALSLAHGRRVELVAGALDFLLDYGAPERAVVALGARLFRRWAADEPAAAWETASGERLAGHWARVVARVWAEDDPRAALDAATRMDSWHHDIHKPWILDLLAEWAEADARAALDWALRDRSSKERDSLVAVAHATLSVVSPEEAAAYELENRALYRGEYWERLRELLGDELRAVAEWMAREPDERLRVFKAQAIARLYGEANPVEAAQWASALPPKESAAALTVLLPSVAKQDFGFAEAIVLSAKSAEAQSAGAQALMGNWPDDLGGPAGAYEWAAENLPPAVRREATAKVFMSWGKQDPSAAVAAWESIADPDDLLANGFFAALAMWAGRDQDEPQQLHERMVALDRVYPKLLQTTPTDPRYLVEIHLWLVKPPASPTSAEEEDSIVFDLYRYWKDRDPSRAAKYKDILENYDGPPPPEQPKEHRKQWARYAAQLKAGKGLRHAWKRMGSPPFK